MNEANELVEFDKIAAGIADIQLSEGYEVFLVLVLWMML